MKTIFRFLFWLKGWRLGIMPEGIDRCVMIAAPHTSNWDAILAVAAFDKMGIPLRFTVKDSWMKFPGVLFIGPVGGIGIDRSPKKPGDDRISMTQAIADLYEQHDRLAIMVTPEGTRSLRTKWKTGFYHIAKLANVPIGLGYLDYKNKVAGVGKLVWPSDDMDKDMREIVAFYKDITPKHPEKYSVDLDYV